MVKKVKARLGWIALGGVVVFLSMNLFMSRLEEAPQYRREPRPSNTRPLSESLPVRPTSPPVRGRDYPNRVKKAEPEAPEKMSAARDQAYVEALSQKDPKPAETALRRAVAVFVDHNRQFADAQAQAEGLSLEEVEELTYFGFFAQHTQRWPEVEAILGHELDPDVRQHAEQLLDETNMAFKRSMRALVADGALAEERWDLIRKTQATYRLNYFALTGMNNGQLQELLAGDLTRRYPQSELPPPERAAQPNTELPGPPPVRPQGAPQDTEIASEL